MKHRIIFFLMTFLLLFPVAFTAAEDGFPWGEEGFSYYQRGDQNFSFTGGTRFPLFYYFPFDHEVDTHGFKPIGWYGSLSWERFSSDSLAFGLELGYSRNELINFGSLVQIPILFTTRWYPFPGNQLDFPLSAKVGAVHYNVDDMEEQSFFGPKISFGGEILWRAFDTWSFGLEAQYSVISEIYFGEESRGNTALGNFLTIALTATFTNR